VCLSATQFTDVGKGEYIYTRNPGTRVLGTVRG